MVVFLRFFELYELYQIVERITINISQKRIALSANTFTELKLWKHTTTRIMIETHATSF